MPISAGHRLPVTLLLVSLVVAMAVVWRVAQKVSPDPFLRRLACLNLMMPKPIIDGAHHSHIFTGRLQNMFE